MGLVEFGFKDAPACVVIAAFVAALALPGCGGRSERSGQSSSGGSSADFTTGGNGASGGSIGVASGGSSADQRSCTEDTDCKQCLYTAAPNMAECARSLGCCGGQVMNESTCTANQAAFQSVCAGQNVSPPICPCVLPGTDCPLACKDGECGFFCNAPATAGRGAQ
jgi:hypothetical protein